MTAAKPPTCTACGKVLLGEPLSSGQCVTCVRAELAAVRLTDEQIAELSAQGMAARREIEARYAAMRRAVDPRDAELATLRAELAATKSQIARAYLIATNNPVREDRADASVLSAALDRILEMQQENRDDEDRREAEEAKRLLDECDAARRDERERCARECEAYARSFGRACEGSCTADECAELIRAMSGKPIEDRRAKVSEMTERLPETLPAPDGGSDG